MVNQAGQDTRYLSLDLWRGAACVMVAAGHAAAFGIGKSVGDIGRAGETWAWLRREPVVFLMSKGWTGVPVFFVISGYCITATAIYARGSSKGAVEFLRRRARRIYPPYWSVLGLLSLVLIVTSHRGIGHSTIGTLPLPSELSLKEWIGNITLTATWLDNVGPKEYRLINTVAWTLCYEEQFYLICCVLLTLCPWRYFEAAVVITIAVVLLNRAAALTGQSHLLNGTFLDGRWWQFSLGIGVYYVLNHRGRPRRRVALGFLAMMFAATCFAQAAVDTLREPLLGNPAFELQVAVVFAAVLVVAAPHDRALYNTQLLRPLRYCGRICYSLYLVHLPVVLILTPWLYTAGLHSLFATVFVAVPIALAAAVIVASCFFAVCERHFLNPSRSAMADTRRRSHVFEIDAVASLDRR